MPPTQLYKCSACGHVIAANAPHCVGCGTPGPIARHPNSWRTAEPESAIAEMLAEARSTPHSPAPEKSGSSDRIGMIGNFLRSLAHKYYQRWIRLNRKQRIREVLACAVGLVLVFAFFSAINPSEQKTPQPSAPAQPTAARVPATTTEEPAASGSEEMTPAAPVNSTRDDANAGDEGTPKRLNEPFTLGDFSYDITEIRETAFLGNEFIHKEAEPNAVYLIVSFQITNHSRETETVLTDDFEVKTASGTTYKPDSDALATYAMSGGNNDLIVSQLQPEITKSTATIFLTPSSAVNSKLFLRVPKKGWMSSGEVIVALN